MMPFLEPLMTRLVQMLHTPKKGVKVRLSLFSVWLVTSCRFVETCCYSTRGLWAPRVHLSTEARKVKEAPSQAIVLAFFRAGDVGGGYRGDGSFSRREFSAVYDRHVQHAGASHDVAG